MPQRPPPDPMPTEPAGATLPTRRAFLAGAGAVALGLALGADVAEAAKSRVSPLVLSGDLYARAGTQRVAFGVAKGNRFIGGAPVEVRFRTGRQPFGPYLPAAFDQAGLPKGRGIYVVTPELATAGVWEAQMRMKGERKRFAIQVNQASESPVVGAAAPRAASPTLTNPLGVDPICTRPTRCPLHDVSLSDVIGTGVPVAAMFATPARCQSQLCGPVLDEMLEVMGPYQAKVRFVHVDIYQSARGTALSPTVTAWNLPTEPWMFGIDGAGVIRGRLDGGFGGQEMKTLLDALVA
jgi:hypothetical protein